MLAILKFPRTPHLQGSRLQPGDHDLSQVPFAALRGLRLVVEEKVDGANAGLSFGPDGELLLQSRGHYLRGGPRERHFARFKSWASCHQRALREVLGQRYLVYGEWMFAKHTVFYDRLPHWFLEFDVYDRQEQVFLAAHRRRALLAGLPILSVPTLFQGELQRLEELTALLQPSQYKSPGWKQALAQQAESQGLDPALVAKQTDPSELAEGLYVKVEEQGRVLSRVKWVRASFSNAIMDSGSHWLSRPIVPNGLIEGARLYG